MNLDRITIAEIAITIEKLLDERDRRKASSSILRRCFEYISAHLALFVILVSLIGAIIGYFALGVSLMRPVEKMAYEQQEEDRKETTISFKNRIVKRHMEIAKRLLDAGKHAEAKKEYDSVLLIDNNHIQAHIGKTKSEIFLSLRESNFDTSVAIMRARLILEEFPDDPHVLTFLGRLETRHGDINKAIQYLKDAIAKDKDLAHAHYGLGIIYSVYEKNDEKALENFKTAHDISPWSDIYKNNLASQYDRLGQYSDALKLYREVAKISPKYLLPYYSISASCFKLADFECAYTNSKRLVAMWEDPEIYDYYRNKKGYWIFGSAETHYLVSTKLEKQAYAHYIYAVALFLLGEQQISEKVTKEIISKLKPLHMPLIKLMRSELNELKEALPSYKFQLDNFSLQFEKSLSQFND